MKLNNDFFHRDCLELAPDLVGKVIVRKLDNGEEIRVRITETEAYRGVEDKACHASKGRTPRTEILYRESGIIYVYLCYGMHWLMNVISGEKEQPQGVLFRAGEGFEGPARLTKRLQVDKSFNGESFSDNERLWIEDDGKRFNLRTDKRVGIDYAGEEWAAKPWRFILDSETEESENVI
ncbi:MAG: DNA-3-methyladenine glycosylase, partial [Oscillospiraceae bacterium]|nr:DNA-3-methyladenine glycosylase [Oscillospiraceae bacterium]